jgi:aconitate hydratase
MTTPKLRPDPFGARAPLGPGLPDIYRLDALAHLGYEAARTPVIVKILLENVLRHAGRGIVGEADLRRLAAWRPGAATGAEVPFTPSRVLLQDFTGVPAVVDLAAMRDAMAELGGDPARINPLVPVDLVIDHSVQVDRFGTADAYAQNVALEYERNGERYQLLRWAQSAFRDVRVVPPGTGIVHQVNLEFLARVVTVADAEDGGRVAFPDTLVGTDSHTTMVNGLGVLGFGVGGIEAEAAMLGQPMYLPMPRVVGVRVTGRLPRGSTATDLVLTVTELLRRHGVVGSFVEFTGEGLADLALADRATVANMSPEYGATAALFPIDDETLAYLRLTGRDEGLVDLVERYARAQGLWRGGVRDDAFDTLLDLDLATIVPSVAGPRRPQDRVSLPDLPKATAAALAAAPRGDAAGTAIRVETERGWTELADGSVVIAAITSCTNTSNPTVMIGAGLLAQKALARGLRVPPAVKTSLAPGSRAVTRYLEAAGLLEPLAGLGFSLVGYGCTTCIGNSGPLDAAVASAVEDNGLAAAAVLSGNRNFEGRIHSLVRLSYLASPPLVVAFALAGRVDIDLTREPLGLGSDGRPVFLADIWPEENEVRAAMDAAIDPALFRETYASVFEGDERWRVLPVPPGDRYRWDPASTYVARPPFLDGLAMHPAPVADIEGARVLAVLSDSVTTDHISPAGSIPAWSPAGQWLQERGVTPADFNSYGARRGHHEVMMRGTFGSIRLRNRLVPDREGPFTVHFPTGEVTTIFEASARYRADRVPLIVIAGREYGSGSSRDWAAKGPQLLGVCAVLAESFERIHRSNLVGMGILPLQFRETESAVALGLTGSETFAIRGLADGPPPRSEVAVEARDGDRIVTFRALARLDGPVEVDYFRNGGIIPAVLRRLASVSAV